jgi:hypothetical protein
MARTIDPAGVSFLLGRHAERIPEEIREGLQDAADRARDELAQRLPVASGTLARSVDTSRDSSGKVAANVGSPLPYAPVIERRRGTFARSVSTLTREAGEEVERRLRRLLVDE